MKDKIFTLANLLTFSRLILTFIFIYLISREQIIPAIICLLLAGLSDLLDGYVARKLNQVSEYGRIFDTAVDGIFLTLTSLSLLAYDYINIGIVIIFLVGGAIRCFSYIKKDKISPTIFSKAVVVLIYALMILSLTEEMIFNLVKWPVAGYHLVISSIDLYRKL